ncbi:MULTISPECIES: hypothetical protein [Bacillus cereus group]|uniref:Uncharacterized protein n=1 Tax=Bacillus thuringiensis TaxID=1428 RepID=A0A9X6Z546_BACTU|nr:hypothetical protein [Bacillus thuringiensis]MEC3272741.1 hypothetical protein [Bacillus thuringiensis]PFB07856.1 hypothetical protein CN398_08945 [Bacillus thuringiensis]HDR7922315.1 hypothetical protein [Bacillus paranthracis]
MSQENNISSVISKNLETANILVVGGHNIWHERIKNNLPNALTLSQGENNIDSHSIRNMDIICVETTFMNHPVYNKIKKLNIDIPIVYTKVQQDVDDLLLELSKLV